MSTMYTRLCMMQLLYLVILADVSAGPQSLAPSNARHLETRGDGKARHYYNNIATTDGDPNDVTKVPHRCPDGYEHAGRFCLDTTKRAREFVDKCKTGPTKVYNIHTEQWVRRPAKEFYLAVGACPEDYFCLAGFVPMHEAVMPSVICLAVTRKYKGVDETQKPLPQRRPRARARAPRQRTQATAASQTSTLEGEHFTIDIDEMAREIDDLMCGASDAGGKAASAEASVVRACAEADAVDRTTVPHQCPAGYRRLGRYCTGKSSDPTDFHDECLSLGTPVWDAEALAWRDTPQERITKYAGSCAAGYICTEAFSTGRRVYGHGMPDTVVCIPVAELEKPAQPSRRKNVLASAIAQYSKQMLDSPAREDPLGAARGEVDGLVGELEDVLRGSVRVARDMPAASVSAVVLTDSPEDTPPTKRRRHGKDCAEAADKGKSPIYDPDPFAQSEQRPAPQEPLLTVRRADQPDGPPLCTASTSGTSCDPTEPASFRAGEEIQVELNLDTACALGIDEDLRQIELLLFDDALLGDSLPDFGDLP